MVFEQLKDKCNCIDVDEASVNELINLISVYTCWANEPCETFLMSTRREVIDLPNCQSGCDVFSFVPFYHPFVTESFVFKLVEQNGITETVTEITDYAYSEVDQAFRLELALPDCKCSPQCGCASTFKLLVTYDAGYEEIPDCLIPVFCEALQWILQKNECNCENCEPCDSDDDVTIIDTGTLTGQLQAFWLETLTNQYRRQLGLISLCSRNVSRIWGFVV